MTHLRWDCEKLGCRLKQRWDPECLDGTLARGATFTDIDAFVEIGRQFLFIEQKKKGAFLDEGQRLALARLAEIPQVTVVTITGSVEDGYQVRDLAQPTFPWKSDHDSLRDWVHNWGKHADDSGSV
jgi:hypothetical protein